jgi:rhamnosyltransferase subunit B
MHVLISAVGSAGDVNPFIAIEQALRRQGHEVELIASAVFAERVARAAASRRFVARSSARCCRPIS